MVETGDVVLIHDDSLASSSRRLGEITELIEGRDGSNEVLCCEWQARKESS